MHDISSLFLSLCCLIYLSLCRCPCRHVEYTHTYMLHMYTCTYVCVCICVYVFVSGHTYIDRYVCTYRNTCTMYAQIHVRIRVYNNTVFLHLWRFFRVISWKCFVDRRHRFGRARTAANLQIQGWCYLLPLADDSYLFSSYSLATSPPSASRIWTRNPRTGIQLVVCLSALIIFGFLPCFLFAFLTGGCLSCFCLMNK